MRADVATESLRRGKMSAIATPRVVPEGDHVSVSGVGRDGTSQARGQATGSTRVASAHPPRVAVDQNGAAPRVWWFRQCRQTTDLRGHVRSVAARRGGTVALQSLVTDRHSGVRALDRGPRFADDSESVVVGHVIQSKAAAAAAAITMFSHWSEMPMLARSWESLRAASPDRARDVLGVGEDVATHVAEVPVETELGMGSTGSWPGVTAPDCASIMMSDVIMVDGIRPPPRWLAPPTLEATRAVGRVSAQRGELGRDDTRGASNRGAAVPVAANGVRVSAMELHFDEQGHSVAATAGATAKSTAAAVAKPQAWGQLPAGPAPASSPPALVRDTWNRETPDALGKQVTPQGRAAAHESELRRPDALVMALPSPATRIDVSLNGNRGRLGSASQVPGSMASAPGSAVACEPVNGRREHAAAATAAGKGKGKAKAKGKGTGTGKGKGMQKKEVDPNLPRPAVSDYNWFSHPVRSYLMRHYAHLRVGGHVANNRLNKLIGDAWSSASREQRLPFIKRAVHDKLRYLREMALYEPSDGFVKQAPRIKMPDGVLSNPRRDGDPDAYAEAFRLLLEHDLKKLPDHPASWDFPTLSYGIERTVDDLPRSSEDQLLQFRRPEEADAAMAAFVAEATREPPRLPTPPPSPEAWEEVPFHPDIDPSNGTGTILEDDSLMAALQRV